MARLITGLFVLSLLATASAQDAPSAKLELSDLFEGQRVRDVRSAFRPSMSGAVRWASDGKHLRTSNDTWTEPLTGKEVEAEPPSPIDDAQQRRTAFLTALSKARGKTERAAVNPRPRRSTIPRTPYGKYSGVRWSADQQAAVAKVESELWAFTMGGEARRLFNQADGLRHLALAPDGKTASFIEDFNLHLVRVSDGERMPLSKDGSETLFYGELDWVYQEEVYGRFNFQGAWWSPNSQHLAFVRIDEEGVGTFTVIDHAPLSLEREELKYPKAGTTNPRATLHVGHARNGKTVAVDLSKYETADEILIVRVGWTPEGDQVVYQVQNREQTWLDLNFADPATGKSKTLFREVSKSWVNVLQTEPHWLKDGSFLWESERNGYKHLYHYDRDGELKQAVTKGEWQVQSVEKVDEEAGLIYFTATEGGAINTNHYRIGLDGEGFTRLTQGAGTHSISWNADRTLFIDRVSSVDNPGEQRLCRADGTIVRVLATAELPKLSERFGMSRPELHRVPNRNGYELDVSVIKPNPFDPNEAYPVWIDSYFGPNAPTVRNRWQSNPWFQFLAQNGVIVMQINVQSASGRGMKDTSVCYQQFGVNELKDIEDVVKWLTAEPWADAERVGIRGWSYGGYMAAYALCHSDMFKLGFAGAGVFDWTLYDTIYTERYMRKPQNNEAGYEKSSVLPAAKNLNGHLVIVHGTKDDNVHFQNAVQLVSALQMADKDFEFMMYPYARHGLRTREQAYHLARLRWKAIREHL